jgi:hypothetical protein
MTEHIWHNIKGGCDVLVEQNSHFYINRNNSKTLYLYPRHIALYTGEKGRILKGGDKRILTGGKDDETFRLDKTICWKVED